MKFKFLTVATLLLTITLDIPAFANPKANIEVLNAHLQQAMCNQDWEKSVAIIDQMLSIPSIEQQRRELREYRSRLQNLATSKTNVNSWLATFCDNPNIAISLKEKLLRSIKKLGITISYENCSPNHLGSYHSGENKMIICQNNIQSEDKYIETLAHESWHMVQDCVGDLNDGKIFPVSVGNSSWFQSMANTLNSSDLRNLSLYESEDLPYEVEAFAMAKHPDLVLKGLDACANNYLGNNFAVKN